MFILEFLKRLIWGIIKRIFYGSSENRKCKFYVTLSEHRYEMKKLLTTHFYKMRTFCNLLNQEYLDKTNIYSRAQELYILDQKCEAYQAVEKSAALIFHKWEEYDSQDENDDEINEALLKMHSNSTLIDHHRMYQWIQTSPPPCVEYEKRTLTKLTEANFNSYVDKIIRAHRLTSVNTAQLQNLMSN